MVATLGLAFLAGILSVLSPCVLPLLPLVLGAAASEHRLGPAALAGGLALSFVVIGLFVATIGFAIGLDAGVFRVAAAILLVLVGLVASHLKRTGIYVVCAAAVIDGLGLFIRLGRWQAHHTARYPFGEDLYPDSSPSSLTNRGQWESEAVHTVHSLVGYAIGLAIAGVLIAVTMEWRRRRHAQSLIVPAGSEAMQTGGVPTMTDF